MIEECGLKGHRIGGAVVSPRHANFIENAGGATSADCIALMAEARRRVHERFGVELEHEVAVPRPARAAAAVGDSAARGEVRRRGSPEEADRRARAVCPRAAACRTLGS